MPYQCNNCKKVHLDIPGFCDCGTDMDRAENVTFVPIIQPKQKPKTAIQEPSQPTKQATPTCGMSVNASTGNSISLCPRCRNGIYQLANVCPHCGVPIRHTGFECARCKKRYLQTNPSTYPPVCSCGTNLLNANNFIPTFEATAPLRPPPESASYDYNAGSVDLGGSVNPWQKLGCWAWGGIILGGLLLIGLIGAMFDRSKPSVPSYSPSAPSYSPPEPRCKTLVRRYSSGEKMEEKTLCNGKLHGLWGMWRRDGSKITEGWFNMGEECGKHRMWDESGKVIDGFDKPSCPSF